MGRDDAGPKYARVIEEIQRRIESREYPPGSLLPSEHQLAAEFKVSRPTIVKALTSLRQYDWIETQQGRGSVVRSRPKAGNPRQAADMNNLVLAEPVRPGKMVISQAGVKIAPQHVTSILNLDSGSRAFLRQRQYINPDGGPSELTSIWLPLDLAEGTELASPEPLKEGIRAHLLSRKKVWLDYAFEHLWARKPTEEEAGLMHIDADDPVLDTIVVGCDPVRFAVLVAELVRPGSLSLGMADAVYSIH